MNSITQDIKYRLSILSYEAKHGVTKTAIKYRTNRQFIYRLKWRYDGTPESLRLQSRHPHSHPNQHTAQEITLIRNMRRRNKRKFLHILRAQRLIEIIHQCNDRTPHDSMPPC